MRLPEDVRTDLGALDQLPVPVRARARASFLPAATPAEPSAGEGRTEFVPLGALAHIRLEEGPNEISRDDGKRRVVVQANVRGRDLGSAVEEAQRRVAGSVEIPAGYWITWGGQFENLLSARARLTVVVLLALLLIFLLLFGAFGSLRDAVVVFTGVPLAVRGPRA